MRVHPLELLVVLLLAAAAVLPPLRGVLEGTMAGHMLIQVPLLVAAGAWAAGALPDRARAALAPWNRGGVPGTLLAAFALAVWMLPLSLDAAVQHPPLDALKALSLMLLAGAPLRLSWTALGTIGRGVVWSNAVAMLAVMGWLYLSAPQRICTSYLLSDQDLLGEGLLWADALLAAGLVLRAFLGGTAEENVSPQSTQRAQRRFD